MAGAWDEVADALGFGGPSGNDHGSSNWAAWGHQEIRSMLDTSVDPGDIHDAARAWRDQSQNDADIVTGCTRDVNGIVSGGWCGASAEAVRVMTNVYPAPINDHRTAVPTYLQLVDPTVQQPDQSPSAGPISEPSGGLAGAAVSAPAHTLSAPVALQGVTSQGVTSQGVTNHSVTSHGGGPAPYGGDQVALNQVSRDPRHGGGQVAAAAAAAGAPIMAPIAAGEVRARVAGDGLRLGGGRSSGYPGAGGHVSGGPLSSGARADAVHSAGYGPRPSSAAAEGAEGRMGGLGRGANPVAGRGVAGDLMPPMAPGRGRDDEDVEHRRPSYLIEMDDIFSDGRKVERARVQAQVCAELRQLALLSGGRVDAELEAALHLLHRPSSWLDSVWLSDAAAHQPSGGVRELQGSWWGGGHGGAVHAA